MKISIWQQFSANHSSDFTLIGEFPDMEQATHAFQELDSLVKEIDAWNEIHSVEYLGLPTPIEYEAGRRYDVEFPISTDWLDGGGASEHAVKQIDNYVTMSTQYRSNELAAVGNRRAFEEILVKLGATSVSNDYGIVSVSCRAPDQHTLKSIVAEISEYLSSIRDKSRREAISYSTELFFPPPPWLVFWNGERDPEAEALLEAWHNMEQRRHASRLWEEQHQNERAASSRIRISWRRTTKRKQLDQQRNQFIDSHVPKHALHDRVRQIDRLLGFPFHYIFKEFTRIELDGLSLNLLNLHFHHVGVGLPAIRAWLQSMGCTEIVYEFVDSESLLGISRPT